MMWCASGILFWLIVTATAGRVLAGSAELGQTEKVSSPHVVLRSLGLADVRWTKGFWAERFETCRRNTIPHLWRIMQATEYSQFYQNFRIAAGAAIGRHRGAPFNDGDFYKWIEAASAVYAQTKNAALDRQLDEIIGVISKAQRADGYLHTPVLIKQRAGDTEARPFANPLGFELYNMGHLITAACVHHRATGKDRFLAVARKTADFLENAFRVPTPELLRAGICPSHYMALVDLYRETGEVRYRALAAKLIDLRDRTDRGSDDNQDRIPLREQTEAVGHAVRANYLYAGAADVFAETGDPSLLRASTRVWADVVSRKLYITGGCGALYDGASPDGSKDQKHITRVHQAYGRAYQLPNSAAHNETCASVAFVLWSWRMLRITGEARFADALERSLYNAVLAGVSLDGRRFFYTNTLRQFDPMPVALRWSRTRQSFISSFCCPPNVARLIAETSSLAYGRSEQTLWVNLYGGSEVTTEIPGVGLVALRQTTAYPWDGAISFRVLKTPDPAWTMKLRIPAWTKGAELAVNGQACKPQPSAGRFAEVSRVWKEGDTVTLNLPMRPRLVQANPFVEETRNQLAIERGPLVYCLESLDLPNEIRVSDVIVPEDIALSARFDPKLLGGATVLEGKAESDPEPAWKGELYRELAPRMPRPITLKLIPYYAWGNRGPSEMTVWLPRKR